MVGHPESFRGVGSSFYILLFFKMAEPFINRVITVGKLKEMQPIKTGKGYEI